MGDSVVYIYSFFAMLVAAGAVLEFWVATRKRIAADTVERAEAHALRIVHDAERDGDSRAKIAILEARERVHELTLETERELKTKRQELASVARELDGRQQALTLQLADVDQRDRRIAEREKDLDQLERDVTASAARNDALVEQHHHELQRVAGMTADEARKALVKRIETDARREAANLVKRLESEARETATDRARHIVTEAIQRSAAEHAIETTVSVVDLPSDDLKGRIIGREGRNIRALEVATGVEVIVHDTPGASILSSFDPFRREVARKSIESLVADGRIHPARIEEVVTRIQAEMEVDVLKDGEAAAFELGLFDLDPEISKLMGRLKFRTSYGQNVLNHSKEVAYLAGIMAKELGLKADVAVRAPSCTMSGRPSTATCKGRISNSASRSCGSTGSLRR